MTWQLLCFLLSLIGLYQAYHRIDKSNFDEFKRKFDKYRKRVLIIFSIATFTSFGADIYNNHKSAEKERKLQHSQELIDSLSIGNKVLKSQNDSILAFQKAMSADNLPNDKNIDYKIGTYQNRKGVFVYPIKGTWLRPFCWYPLLWMNDTNKTHVCIVNSASLVESGKLQITRDGHPHRCLNIQFQQPCSMTSAMFIDIEYEYGFFIFGDWSNENKWYLYDKGKIAYFTDLIGKVKYY